MTSTNPILRTAAGEREDQDRGAIITCESRQVLIVADGAGGTSGGAEAAATAIEFARRDAERLTDSASCVSLLQKIDQAIAHDPNAGDTTCALAVITDELVFGASVGDSGVWLIGESDFKNLTRHQSRKPLIGSGSALPIPFTQEKINHTLLLLATDGLLKYASSERIIALCHDSQTESTAKRLIELVRYPSGALPDDVTIILTILN